MKTKILLLLSIFITTIAFSVMVTSCKSSKQVGEKPEGEQLIQQYCTGSDYRSNEEFQKASGVGESMDQSVAKKKALANARGELAQSIKVSVSGALDNFNISREKNNTEDLEERFVELSEQVYKQNLTGSHIICDKMVKTEDKNYKSYIAIELSLNDVVKAIDQGLSEDDKARIDYDYEKFKEEYEKALKKYEAEN